MIELLRKTTLKSHKRLHQHSLLSVVTQKNVTYREYATVLYIFNTFYTEIEKKLASCVSSNFFSLSLDLQRLKKDITALNLYIDVPCFQLDNTINFNLADDCFGVFYVLKGSHLGGLVIAKNIQKTLGLTQASGLSFFIGEGEHTAITWKKFINLLEQQVTDEKRCINAASAIFQQLETYLWHVTDTLAHDFK